MGLADLVEVEDESVDVVQRANALVQRGHDGDGVLGQFLAAGLLVSRRQLVEFCEQIQQLLVLLEQPVTRKQSNRQFRFPFRSLAPTFQFLYAKRLTGGEDNSRKIRISPTAIHPTYIRTIQFSSHRLTL